jgi:antitoxin YefM
MEATYSYARAHLAELWDKAISNCEPVVLKRRGHEDVALISARELSSMLESIYLMRSPANARQLLDAYERAMAGEGETVDLDDLRRTIQPEE